jgi:hypothetical protein
MSLYDLAVDPGEAKNLAAERLENATELKARLAKARGWVRE